jgi:serine protease Do
VTPELARRFGLGDAAEGGVVVVRIDPGSPAYEGGVRPGDMIIQVNQMDIATLDDFKKAVAKLKKKDRTLLLIRRKGEELFLTIRTE